MDKLKPESYELEDTNFGDKTIYAWVKNSSNNVSNVAIIRMKLDDIVKPNVYMVKKLQTGCKVTFKVYVIDNMPIESP